LVRGLRVSWDLKITVEQSRSARMPGSTGLIFGITAPASEVATLRALGML
jgi:hypothetical protein